MRKLIAPIMASALAFVATAQGAVELTVKPERTYLLTGGPRDAVIQIELRARRDDRGKRTAPINLALVLDKSGSMAGAKLEKAKQAACVAVDQLGADDTISVVVYDDDVSVLIAPQKVRDREALKAEINRIRDGGSTALYAGVEKGAAQIRKYLDREKVNRIILLSDGIANVGPSRPADLAKLGKELRQEGFGVSTIGLGDDYNEDLMTALAEASHANYYYVRDAEKLPGIFSEELGTVKSVVARNVRVTITFPDGVRPEAVLGEDVKVSGQTVTIPLAELYGAQTRRFLVSCRAPETDAAEIDLAAVTLKYDDAGANRAMEEKQSARIGQTTDRSKVEQSLQAEVAANAAVTRNRLAKEEAVRLADAGRTKDAADLLRRQASANAALPAAAQSPLLRNEDAELKNRAAELETDGELSKSSRKKIQYDNYQDKTQKR